MLTLANKNLFKYVRKFLSKNLGNRLLKYNKVDSDFRINPITQNKFSHTIRTFCSSEISQENHEEIKLSQIIAKKDLKLSKLIINLLKYLERNFDTYQRICEDSIKLSYDLSESPDGNDFLKSELMRINRQISTFSKDNYFFEEMKSLINQIDSSQELIREAEEIQDDEIKSSAIKELADSRQKLEELQAEIIEYLIPDEFENVNVLSLEIKAAAGGTEGALFAEDLVSMYKKYCLKMGFDISTVSYSADNNLGKGCKNGTFRIRGESAFKYFQWESGVHKVQRVPITEKMGRVHSSTCQVAIFADKSLIYDDINERDLRIDFFRASGAGGQSVNKTESAVRITHIPTGIVVQNQDERDQHRNKAKAMEVLKKRIHSNQLTQFKDEINEQRRNQHGTGNLSEKIRTYNWPDSRVTDHRLGVTLYGIDQMLEGDHLETLIDKSIESERIKKLNSVLNRLNEE